MPKSSHKGSSKIRKGEKVDPEAGALSESLRDFGYTLPHAIADLIDNSLTAGASEIYVTVHSDGPRSHIAVVDNGEGLSREELVEAMRMGTKGPLIRRESGDLGRFGLGMKTASLSQGRALTVISRRNGQKEPIVRKWDLEHIAKAGWELLKDPSPVAKTAASPLNGWESGTAVIIERLDRAAFNTADGHGLEKNMSDSVHALSKHLAMVFHRFISEDGIMIQVGSTSLKAWDPFMTEKSTRLPPENLALGKMAIAVTPYVLPHHSFLTEEQHGYSSGPKGWNEHQGFYIYRNRRLVVPGSWLNLGLKKDEHCKLARIQIDLPNSMDGDWQLNVIKSHVSIPAALRPEFMRIATDVRRQAGEVYRYRGERQAPTKTPPERFVWRRKETTKGVRFQIDRTHPVVQSLIGSSCPHAKLLEQVLDLVERSVPIASIIAEPAKSLDGSPISLNEEDIKGLVELAAHTVSFLVRTGLSLQRAREKLMLAEPFASNREQIASRLWG